MVTTIKRGSTKTIIKERLKALYSQVKTSFDASQFCDVLNLENDALDLQKRLRNEWE